MGKVIILDENTSNKIAAGEVIERPASVVKELVENSIDAGATKISVEIKNGGISFIKITDNGSGIEEDDLEIAFERHSTSKIRGADDLFSISTLGFRGEALASIAAVSTVEVVTRTENNPQGSYIKIQGGTVKDVRQTGCPVGTTFTVKELFYNTPARFKFLKKDSTEAGYVTDIISRIALANPQISFKLVSKGSTIIHTPGNNDLQSTIFSIYGRETANGLVPINYADSRVKITGYAGKPQIARANRNHQSIYVNGRYVKSRLVSSAIDEAYKTMLMKNKHPFIVINIKVNPMAIDVNVHPTKMEVRFSDEQEIFRSIYHAINSALLNQNQIRESSLSSHRENPFKAKTMGSEGASYVQQGIRELNKPVFGTKVPDKGFSIKDPDFDSKVADKDISTKEPLIDVKVSDRGLPIKGSINAAQPLESKTAKAGSESSLISKTGYFSSNNEENYKAAVINETTADGTAHKAKTTGKVQEPVQESSVPEFRLSEALIIGQAFSTYILLQTGDNLYLVDQHAAHERLLYEKLKNKVSKGESPAQMLISPVVIELTPREIKFLEEHQLIFNKLGFIYEDFGNNSILLRAVPCSDEYIKVKEGFLEVLDLITSTENKDFDIVADEALYSMACKAAVKANRKLSEPEIRNLLSELDKIENPFTCPHGRPTVIKMTKYELEKLFKRIV